MKKSANNREDIEATLRFTTDIPIVVISYGENYEDIGELVENSAEVMIIAIFTNNLEFHLEKQRKHGKIAGITNNINNLHTILRKGYKNYIRFSNKFLDEAEEQTFHELKEQREILDGMVVEGMFFKQENNITYPLYYEGFQFE